MKKLVLFTDGFPFLPGEVPFIYNELLALVQMFDVCIVARVKSEKRDAVPVVEIPSEVKLLKYVIDDVDGREKIKSLGYALSKKAFYHELFRLLKVDRRLCVFKEMYTYLTATRLFMEWLKSQIDIDSIDVFYTYWNSYATLGISFLKNKASRYKLVTRTHRYDLYNERTIYYRQYFKDYVDGKLDKVFFIAEHGMEYYIDNFAKSDKSKYVMNNIGVVKAGSIPKKGNSDEFLLVSCSNVISVKRVDLIVKALAQIEDLPIRWIHMGDGKQFDELKELCATLLGDKKNISYELLGRLTNVDVRKFYDNNYVDFFITTSASEGSPVSIQEALAYGIPIIGTTVGEVDRLVLGNGFLLKEDPEIEEVATAIKDAYALSTDEYLKMREQAFAKWKNKYDVKKNSEDFVQMLMELE